AMSVSAARASTRTVTPVAAAQSARNYEREIYASEMQVARENEQTAAMNERIVSVLANVSGQNFGDNPRAWWDWWQDQTDYYRGTDRPICDIQDSSKEVIRREEPQSRCECFVRGTPVWTKTGKRAIESLRLG